MFRKLFTTIITLCAFGLTHQAQAARRSMRTNFGASRGLTFYTSPDLATINSRLGNSPRLSVDHEFGRAITHAASVEFSNKLETLSWGFEGQQWAETIRGVATSGDTSPRSESTLAFLRLWATGGVRLWPWVGPVVVKRNTNIFGRTVVMNKARSLGSGFYSHLKIGTGPLLWRHDYQLSDLANQTQINYGTRTLSWEGGVRLTLGWRLGSFCDLGFDISGSRSWGLKGENAIGQYFLSGRDMADDSSRLSVDTLASTPWQTTQALVFLRFFYP